MPPRKKIPQKTLPPPPVGGGTKLPVIALQEDHPAHMAILDGLRRANLLGKRQRGYAQLIRNWLYVFVTKLSEARVSPMEVVMIPMTIQELSQLRQHGLLPSTTYYDHLLVPQPALTQTQASKPSAAAASSNDDLEDFDTDAFEEAMRLAEQNMQG